MISKIFVKKEFQTFVQNSQVTDKKFATGKLRMFGSQKLQEKLCVRFYESLRQPSSLSQIKTVNFRLGNE